MTKAKTIQASKKFRKWWPCQKFRVSAGRTEGAAATMVVDNAVSLPWFHSESISGSLTPTTFIAVDPHISQFLYTYATKQDQYNIISLVVHLVLWK